MNVGIESVLAECYGLSEMPGKIKPRGACRFCGGIFERSDKGFECAEGCKTTPSRYLFVVYVKPWGKVRLFATRAGDPIASWRQAIGVETDVARDLVAGSFDPARYRVRSKKERLFVTYGDGLIESMEREAEAGERNREWVGNFKSVYTRHVRPYFLRDEIETVRALRIRDFLLSAAAETGSKHTYRHIKGTLRRVLGYAVEMEAVPRVPAFPRIPGPRGVIRRVTWLTEAEQDQLIGCLDPLDRPIVGLLARCGLRPSEAWRLDAEDFEATSGKLRIRRSKVNPRVIVLPVAVAAEIKQYIASRRVVALPGARMPLFLTSGGLRYSKLVLGYRWDAAMRAAISAGYIPETKRCPLNMGCRHSFISQRREAGVSREAVAAYAGNSPAIVAAHYEHGAIPFPMVGH